MYTRHTTTYYHNAFGEIKLFGKKRGITGKFGYSHRNKFCRFVGIGLSVFAYPGNMFADIGHFQHIRIQARPRYRAAEGVFVHTRGAGGHNHTVQMVFPYGLFNRFLPGFGTGVHGICGIGNIGQGKGRLRHSFCIHCGFYITAAMADKNTYIHTTSAWAFSRTSVSLFLRFCAIC